jgi:hypothetical protein
MTKTPYLRGRPWYLRREAEQWQRIIVAYDLVALVEIVVEEVDDSLFGGTLTGIREGNCPAS